MPVCHETAGISSETILQGLQGQRGGVDRSMGVFHTLFNCALSMLFIFTFEFILGWLIRTLDFQVYF